MRAVVLTSGDPDALTGGSLFHRRIAEHAPGFGVRLDIVSLDAAAHGSADTAGADAFVVDSIVAARIDPHRFDVPVVASVHQRPGGLVGARADRLARAMRDLRCYRRADAVIVPSAFLARVLRRFGIDAGRVRLVEPGSDGPDAATADAFAAGAPTRGVAFVSVGNLSAHKRPLELLEAFAAVGDADGSLTLIGGAADPNLGSLVAERVAGADVAGRARWLGSRPPAEVAAALREADVFVTPALDESYGMAVAEALRAGLPAVVSASGNLPALVRDGVDGFVVPARDPGAFAAAMRRLALEDALRDAMSARARRGAERFPSWHTAAARFAAVLHGAHRPSARRSAA